MDIYWCQKGFKVKKALTRFQARFALAHQFLKQATNEILAIINSDSRSIKQFQLSV
jgi:hypothetical protein